MAFLEMTNVGKRFGERSATGSIAVRNFNLSLQQGDFLCLLGPSGCGKSTVLSMLAGFEQPSEGQITLAGHRVTAPSRDKGVVFQGDDSLFPWLNALQNIEFGLRVAGMGKNERREVAIRYLRLVGLGAHGDKPINYLSGGMKQRVQIARALATQPAILLMDEPFGALDAQTRLLMQKELHRIWSTIGSTIVFITHDIDEALLLGNRIGIMTAGPAGTLKAVLPVDFSGARERNNPRYTEMYMAVHDVIRDEVTNIETMALE
jgi:NitT/TauT family transport system ATP-binding protein